MFKVAIAVLMFGLMVTGSAVGQDAFDLKGKMLTGGYLGYTLGFGDPFGETDFIGGSTDFSAGFSFGGHFHYGVSPKMLIGGELGFQSYNADVNTEATSIGGFSIPSTSTSAGDTELNILGTALYAMNYTEDQKALYLTFGAGIYGGASSEFGFNGGVLWRTMVSPTIGLYVMPRFHLIMADTTMKMLQIAVGVQIPLGAK